MLEEFADIARGLSFSEPRIPIISNLTGEVVSGEELCSAEYPGASRTPDGTFR